MFFVSMILNLSYSAHRILSDSDSEYAHAAIFHILTDLDPLLGAELHDAQRNKPVTIAILGPKKNSAILRMTFMAQQGIQYANALATALVRNPDLRLKDIRCQIANIELNTLPWCGIKTWDDLSDGPASGKITIDFITPTAINKVDDQKKRFTGLLPDPESIFGGLARRWQANSGPELSDRLNIYLRTGGCVVSNYRMQTVTFSTSSYRQIGFVGSISYECRKDDPECIQAICSLARFAFFSGVGYHTAQGMGTVRVLVG